jgi:uncharacterized protein
LPQFPVVVLTGARQVGKSSLLRALLPEYTYVTLDLPSIADLANRDPERFLREYPAPLLVDEVQYAPNLFRHLKVLVDQSRQNGERGPGQYVLTGSQKFVLMKVVSESLAGRAVILELETLSFEEIAEHNPYPKSIAELLSAMVRGGFPELWATPEVNSSAFYQSYLATYLERDVRQILNVASLRDFERFVRSCAARSGQLLDKAALARDVGVSSKAANDWLSVLEASNQVHLLEPYFENVGKRMIKSPKLYFADTGLLCFLLGLDEASLLKSPYLGAVWESLVYAQLRKARRNPRDTFWFYRDAQQQEVDFLIASGNERHLVEVKWTEHPDATDTRVMRRVFAHLESRGTAVTSNLVCRTPHQTVMADGTRVLDVRGLPRATMRL